MKIFYLTLSMGLGLAAVQTLAAQNRGCLPPCEPGYRWEEVTTYKDVPHFNCKVVPNTKKKWVYKVKEDAFCLPARDGRHCGEGCGDTCCGPFHRNLLVKWQIDVPCPGTKCIVETVMKKMPCTEYRKVPCTLPQQPASYNTTQPADKHSPK